MDGLNVHGDRIADPWVFSRKLPEECCSCLYISMCPKMICCCVKYCVQIWSFYIRCLNFPKIQVVLAYFLSIQWIYHRYIVSIVLIYFWCRDIYVVFKTCFTKQSLFFKTKLFKVSITFVTTVLVGWLSQASVTGFIPSLFGMFVYNDFTSGVTSKQSFGMFFIFYLIFKRNLLSLLHIKKYFWQLVGDENQHTLKKC